MIEAHYTTGQVPFLRYQAKRTIFRKEKYPIYGKDSYIGHGGLVCNPIIGYEESIEEFPVTHLMGWGETREQAEKMAYKSRYA